MSTFARKSAILTVLGITLVGCGTQSGTGGTADGPRTPSPGASATAASPARTGEPTGDPSGDPSGGPGAGPERRVPTLAPGPGGLAAVFERAAPSRGAAKTVALTFDADMTADQGPRAARGERFDNPGLIAALRELKVPSTVFMTGRWAEEYPDQARSIGIDPLFETANHSWSHYAYTGDCYGLPVVGRDEMRTDVERAFRAFEKAGVRNTVPYFRFPGGCYDDAALRAVAPTGVTAVQWDVVGGDAFATDADAVAEQVLAGVRPGSLVVLHCTRSAAPVTEAAVRRVVPELRRRGFTFVKVSDLMRPDAP
ncbi:polysaccharide deacetylase family protein [Streptomyces sp. NPDC005805]|uniref:polysaccharide deacetylase family protein n=1 Tax=Streptomyces sp. NPDC005805 TaxID=3157068 RepID=UPI0033E350C2